jgi:transcriptional regulator with XRE-family HTH domain
MAEVSPTVRLPELGLRLRELRTSRNLIFEEVAESLLCSASKISRAKTGARRPSLRDVRDLCELYGVGPEESAQLMELASAAYGSQQRPTARIAVLERWQPGGGAQGRGALLISRSFGTQVPARCPICWRAGFSRNRGSLRRCRGSRGSTGGGRLARSH